MSAAQRLQEVEARLAELSRSKEDLKAQIVHVVSPQPDVEETIAADSGIDPHEVAAGLAAAVDAKLHVKSLKELQEPMRELERAARTVVRSAAEGAEAYWQAVGNACSCYRTVGPLCSAVESTPAAVEHTVLQDLSQQLLSRAKVSLASIDKACREHLERRLSECGWPPPLAAPKGSVLGTEKGTSFWERLEKQGGGLLDGLLLSLAALTMVQVAVEERTGEPAGECLWFMDVMAATLEERLRTHFASNRKTSDINQPEWLFATALKLIREHGDGMAFFEGRLQTQPVDYTLAFQRRIQAAVKGLLRSSHLPALLSLGSRDLWRDWAVAAAQFDRDVAEATFLVREVGVAYSGDVRYSCLNAFCERQEWMVAWCDAESHALVAEVEELMAAPDAWEPPKAQDWEGDEPEAASRGGTASGHELWPPHCAQGAWSLVESVVQRVEGLGLEHRAHYLRNVAGPGLREVLRKLGAIMKQAEAYKQLTAPNWAAKVCGCACAAHYFEHHLQELVYNSSLLEVGGAEAVFGKEMSTLVGFRREQCMKLAKAVAMEFGHTSSSYRKQLHLFSSADGAQTSAVTATLAGAIVQLHERFAMLSTLMDVVCFREVWRAVAMAATRVMFNDVATEAHFSQQGALLFKTDCEALMEVFRPFTPRPHTHMKELHEACILLNLPTDTARQVYEDSKAPSPRNGVSALLKSLGVVRLKPEQAICVLLQRI